MNDTRQNVRQQVKEHVALLASSSEQRKYQNQVPHVPVIQELICGFADDLFHPKSPDFINAFSETELKDLCVLFGLVHRASQKLASGGVCALDAAIKAPEWREVMDFAKNLKLE